MTRSFAAALALVCASSVPALAEIAVMPRGRILYIESFERIDDEVTLRLEGGGAVTVPAELVVNIVPNEIVEEAGAVPQQVQLFPQLDAVIQPAALKYDLDPNLVAAVIWAESSGDPGAVSSKGAHGLMQLMPDTARELGVVQILDPHENVDGGTRYLRQLIDAHEGDLSLALAAYNAGPETVRRYGGIPPYRETRGYVDKVLSVYARAKGGEE